MIYRPELCTEEKLLSYAKYYYIDPDPLNPLAAQILRQPIAKEDVLWPEDVETMFAPGYQDAMLGYCLFEGGSYSSLYAQLPGVNVKMLDWWFVWMTLPPKSVPREQGNLRYKIWCPLGHWDHGYLVDGDPSSGTPRHPVEAAPPRDPCCGGGIHCGRPGRQLPNNPPSPYTQQRAFFAPGLLGLYQCLRAAERSGLGPQRNAAIFPRDRLRL